MPKNQLSIYHRAFKAYVKELQNAEAERKLHEALMAGRAEYKKYLKELELTEEDPKLHQAIAAGRTEKEYMDSTRYSCTVKTDWIEHIEVALPYLEKAVMENRQFILQHGDIVLIEQAKRISKTSVEHLAHHSEMITHAPEPGKDLIPDKIYMVENDDNHAVYENRFLYMLLCQLREFVDVRYTRIVKTWNTFSSDLFMNKKVRFGKRTLKYAITLNEIAEDDATTAYDRETQLVLARLRYIQQTVNMLLNMPLMKDVSHAPLLKPPITRTNVLRMDPNFREAVTLFDYLSGYHEDGFTVHEIHERMEPFSAEATDDFAEVLAALSYLSYRYGGHLQDTMEHQYREEEKALRDIRERETLEQLAELKRQVGASGKSSEQYLHALEQRNIAIERERVSQRELENRLFVKEQEVQEYKSTCRELSISANELERSLKQQAAIMQRQKMQLEQEIETEREKHLRKMEEKQAQLEAVQEQLTLTAAQLHGIRQQHGMMTDGDDFSTKEGFAQLEQEYAAFNRFYDVQWKKAKKGIRKRMLWNKSMQKSEAEHHES